jgi:ribosomal-protein-alanine N-acetyltransferase
VQPPVQYRLFDEQDLHQVLQLANEALDESYDGGLFLHFARMHPEAFQVAEAGDEIVGFVMGTVQRAYEARILALAVDENWRRHGVATRLTERFLSAFQRHGIKRVSLEVRCSNEPAIGLYESMGFERDEVLEEYYTDDEDAYRMVRTI